MGPRRGVADESLPVREDDPAVGECPEAEHREVWREGVHDVQRHGAVTGEVRGPSDRSLGEG